MFTNIYIINRTLIMYDVICVCLACFIPVLNTFPFTYTMSNHIHYPQILANSLFISDKTRNRIKFKHNVNFKHNV